MALALAFGLIAGAWPAWYWTATYKDASWKASVEQQEIVAARQLQEATEHARAVERAQALVISELETKHHEAETTVTTMRRANLDLATQLGGLRDPGRRPRGQCPVPGAPAGASLVVESPASPALSAEATEFLLGFAADADEAAVYAGTCYEWVAVAAPLAEKHH